MNRRELFAIAAASLASRKLPALVPPPVVERCTGWQVRTGVDWGYDSKSVVSLCFFDGRTYRYEHVDIEDFIVPA